MKQNPIKISKTTKGDIEKFDDSEWKKMDMEHYGRKNISWEKRHFVFKATKDRKIVGAITGNVEAGVIYVGTIIVFIKERGQGIGSLLISKAIEFGKIKGAHKIWLITGREWRENNFYQKLGFSKIADLPKHYLEHDFVIYSKPI